MKSKFYWEQHNGSTRPFDLPRRITEGINACKREIDRRRSGPSAVRYIWIYLTDQGLRNGDYESSAGGELTLDDWLNIIDESAALGAQWVMIYVGASLSQCPLVWPICEWAQQAHGLNVGLHITSESLSEEDVSGLLQLEAPKTFIVAEDRMIGVRQLQDRGVCICRTDLYLTHRVSRCTKPADIACVGPDGRMFSCGHVMGDSEFVLGDARSRPLANVMRDESLPHVIEDMSRHPETGCSACPSLLAAHLQSVR